MVTARNRKSKNFKGQMSGAPGTAFYRQDDACPVGFITAKNKTKKKPNPIIITKYFLLSVERTY